MEVNELQSLLLKVIPQWNYRISRPFKQLFEDNVTPPMFFCMELLRINGSQSMSSLGRWSRMPKQQMTKLVNKLIACDYVRRTNHPEDRRVVLVELSEKGLAYTQEFEQKENDYYRNLLLSMDEQDREEFGQALETIKRVLEKLPCDCKEKEAE